MMQTEEERVGGSYGVRKGWAGVGGEWGSPTQPPDGSILFSPYYYLMYYTRVKL